MLIIRYSPFAVTLLAAATLVGCARPDSSHQPAHAEPMAVQVATVAMRDVADSFDVAGIVQAQVTATLSARILAPVSDVRVLPGDRVRAGQVLVLLDGRELGAQARSARASAAAASRGVAAAEAEHQSANAALTLARSNHDRVSGLQSRRSATAQELDEATSTLHAAESRVSAAQARIEEARSASASAEAATEAAVAVEAFTRITAPFDGLVTEKLVEPGNMVAPGMPVVRVEDTRGFRLDVLVDESRLGEIATGSPVAVSIETGGTGPAAVSGSVSEVSRSVDADRRAFLVKVALPATAGLRSGAYARARFEGRRRPRLTVPAAALVEQGQVTSAFVADEGIARLRLVRVRGTEVLAGLAAGETVVLSPPPGLVDGRPITAGGAR